MKNNVDPELIAKIEAAGKYKPTKDELQQELNRLQTNNDGSIQVCSVSIMNEHQTPDRNVKFGPIPGCVDSAWMLMWHRFDPYAYRDKGFKDLDIGPFTKIIRVPVNIRVGGRTNPPDAINYYQTKKPVRWNLVQSPRAIMPWPEPQIHNANHMTQYDLSSQMVPFHADWQKENVLARRKFDVIRTHRALSKDQRSEMASLITKSVSEVLASLGYQKND